MKDDNVRRTRTSMQRAHAQAARISRAKTPEKQRAEVQRWFKFMRIALEKA